MPRRRIGRRGRVGTPSAGAPAQGTLATSVTSISGAVVAGAGAVALDDTFTITNVGAGGLAGTLVAVNQAWLSVSLSIAADGTITVTSTVDATSLAAGSETASYTITDANASNSGLVVTLDLTVTASSPTINSLPIIRQVSLVDETAGIAQSYLVSNGGHGTLATPTVGVITYSGAFTNWITSTQVTDNGDDTFTVTATPTAVGGTVGGPYTATIPIVSAGATNTPLSVTMELTVLSATTGILALDRNLDDATFTIGGATPPTQTVGIRNIGTGVLAGPTVSNTSYTGDFTGWGTATITNNTLSVAFDTSGILTAGNSNMLVTVSDANCAATVVYTIVFKTSGAVAQPAIRVSPTSISVPVVTGTNHPDTTIAVTNANGGLANLGTVSVAFSPSVTWCTPTYSAGTITLAFTTSALTAATYSGSLVVSATLATNSPVTVPVQVVVTDAPAPSTYPEPQLAALPNGWTWSTADGYPTGSCFNELGALAAGYDGARPAFAGTVHTIPGSYANWTSAMTAVTAGTIVPGDIIRIDKAQTITDPQFPVIPGWTAGDGFICVQSSDMASLPAYSYDSGPDSFGVDNRGGKNSHLAFMPTMQTTTLNRSVLNFQIGSGGYWLEGIRIHSNTATPTSAIVSLGPRNGTQPSGGGVLANLPQCIVIDRCRLSSANGHQNVIEAHGRYVRITHSTLDYARRPGLSSDNYENKVAYMVTTDGHYDFLGNECSSLGIGMIIGGSDPNIANVNPSDGILMWNRYKVPDLTGLPDQDDSKNFYENKTGKRWFVGFNVVSGLWMRPDQKFQMLFKAVDTPNLTGGVCNNPQTLFAAHVTDICYWANKHYDCAKGFIGGADIFNGGCGNGGAIGTERIEVAWNLSISTWTGKIPTKWAGSFGSVDRMQIALYKSSGDGIPGVHIYHNTIGSTDYKDQDFLEVDSVSLGTGWSNVVLRDNVMISQPLYGPVRGNQSSNTTALNGTFGPGNWNLQYNLIAPGTATWDATLLGGNYLNGYLVSGGTGVNFTSPATYNYSLISGHPKAGVSTDGKDPGYNHTYLTAMTSTVLADGE